jgi:acyl transferase domain-containing protein
MMAVAMSKEGITPYLEDVNRLDCFEGYETTIAAINSPQNVTLSGTQAALQSLKSRLDSEGIFCREINTGVGYHSHFMFDIAERYREAIQDLDAGQMPTTPVRMISTVTGDIQFGIERLRDADYWIQNMVQPVKFSDAMIRLADFHASKEVQEIIGQGVISDVIEIGPHPALKRYVEESLVNTQEEIRYNSTLSRFEQTPTPILELVGHLYCRGYAVNVEETNGTGSNQPQKPRCLTDLPEYPFNRQRFWHESKLSEGLRFRKFLPHPLLGTPVSDFNPLEAKWRNTLCLKQLPWLADHKVSTMN